MNIGYELNGKFRGSALIMKNNRVILEVNQGFADWANQVPNDSDTKYASASAGKAFVAVGILQLIERGKLSFDDTLGQILDMNLHRIDPDVTIKQLLTHRSGVPDYFDESVMEEYEELWIDFPNYKIRHNRDLLPLFIETEMMYPKGERFQYNNTGYVLLAMVIEQITGLEFDQYLQEHVFDVCQMTSTGYYELDRLPAKCAMNYIYCEDSKDYRTNIFSVDAKGTGAGGAFITIHDIANFWNGLRDYKLLSADMTHAMLQKQSGDGSDPKESCYGYGFWILDGFGSDIPYFQGSDPGVSFISEYNPEENTVCVLVSNYGDNVWKEMKKIRRVLYK